MPGDINFETCEIMTRTIGVDGTSDFFQQLWPRVWAESPFMSSFIQGVLRLHRDPGAFVKYLRVGYVADSLVTLYEAGGYEGTVRVAEVDPARRDAVLEFAWIT